MALLPSSQLFWASCLAVLALQVQPIASILCYECDEFPSASESRRCPGGSIINFGNKIDADQACIVYRLDSGRIVFQQQVTMSTSALCNHRPEFLRGVIKQYFHESGTAMCCRSDGCNKDIPNDFAKQKGSKHIFLEDFRAEQAGGVQQESLRRAAGDGGSGSGTGSSSAQASVALTMGLLLVAVGPWG